MKISRLLIAGLMAAGSSAVFAADEGGRPGAFLDYAASARSLGMGQAFTAIANDPSAIYWNPSGTAGLLERSLVAQFSTLAEESSFGFIGYAQPWRERGGFGLGVVNLQSGSIPKRDAAGNKVGEYQAVSNAVLLSGGFRARHNLSFGTTAKVIRESLAGHSAVGLGLDAGTLFRANEYLQVGVALRNLVAPSITLKSEKETYPRSAVLGFGVTPIAPLTLGLDFEKQQGAGLRTRFGADFLINRIISIRAGLNDSEMTAGMGLGLGSWNFDYALGYTRASSEIRELGQFHRFGFQFNFGAPQSVFTGAPRAPLAGGPAKAPAPARSRNQPALDALSALGEKMDSWTGEATPEIQDMVNTVSRDLKRGRFVKPQHIYAAQGYVSYFTGDYARSVRSLENALKANRSDDAIRGRLKLAQEMNVRPSRRNRETPELRAVRQRFERGDYAGTVVLAQRMLEISPKNRDAAAYLRKALDKVVLPHLRQAKELLDKGRFVESFVRFQKTLDYDPENPEAKAYSDRLVRVIEKNSDVDYLTRSLQRSGDLADGLRKFEEGLRLYAHGDAALAKTEWEQALPLVAGHAVLHDTIRQTISDLR